MYGWGRNCDKESLFSSWGPICTVLQPELNESLLTTPPERWYKKFLECVLEAAVTDVLEKLHQQIDACRICEKRVIGFKKPPRLDRGVPGRLLVVGQGPGRSELRTPKAFAGQSGRRLNEWLTNSGADPADPRKGIYFTSVLKCYCPKPADFPTMSHNCLPFLQAQLTVIKPELVVTLGRRAYEALRLAPGDYEHDLCNPQLTSEQLLFTQFGFHFWLLHWPHPSGLNRWLNLDANRLRLSDTFAFVHRFLERLP